MVPGIEPAVIVAAQFLEGPAFDHDASPGKRIRSLTELDNAQHSGDKVADRVPLSFPGRAHGRLSGNSLAGTWGNRRRSSEKGLTPPYLQGSAT
jgi:hypothetical protein